MYKYRIIHPILSQQCPHGLFTHAEASQECQARNSKMAVISAKGDEKYLQKFLKKGGSYWVGLKKDEGLTDSGTHWFWQNGSDAEEWEISRLLERASSSPAYCVYLYVVNSSQIQWIPGDCRNHCGSFSICSISADEATTCRLDVPRALTSPVSSSSRRAITSVTLVTLALASGSVRAPVRPS